MAMSNDYLNLIRDAGQAAITHIGLVNAAGTELSGGGYARLAVTWVDDGNGVSRPNGNLVFTTESGDEVAGWRGFSASSGGTNYGGGTLATVTFSNPGTYTLLAASTSISHTAS
jgi:hypothetical protein